MFIRHYTSSINSERFKCRILVTFGSVTGPNDERNMWVFFSFSPSLDIRCRFGGDDVSVQAV